jgi:hypothetical protein
LQAEGEAEAAKMISFYCITNLIIGESVNIDYTNEVTEIPIIGKYFNIKITEYKLKYYGLQNNNP